MRCSYRRISAPMIENLISAAVGAFFGFMLFGVFLFNLS